MQLLKLPKYAHIAHQFVHQLIERTIAVPNRAFELFLIETLPSLLTSAMKTA